MREDNVALYVRNIKELEVIAEAIAAAVEVGDKILLQGELGAGKTALASCIIRKLCSKVTDIISPTFPIMRLYDSDQIGQIAHIDLYRVRSAAELENIGINAQTLQELGLALVEWPELIQPQPNSLVVNIEHDNNCEEARYLQLHSSSAKWRSFCTERGLIQKQRDR